MLPPENPFLTTLSLRLFGLTDETSESSINRILLMLLVSERDLELDPGNVLGAGLGLWGVALVRSVGVDVLLTTSIYCLSCKYGSSEAGLGR